MILVAVAGSVQFGRAEANQPKENRSSPDRPLNGLDA
jgi:hypothetical protein